MANNITTVKTESDSITLKKGSKGDYSWEIKKYGDELFKIIDDLESANEQLKKIYGGDK